MGKATKTHREDPDWDGEYTICGVAPNDPSVVKPTWRNVTCKNCLKQKK